MQEVDEYFKTSDEVKRYADFAAKYDLKECEGNLMGEGSFGRVYRCSLKSDPSQQYAVKLMSMAGMTQCEIEEMHNEVVILKNVDHKHALKM